MSEKICGEILGKSGVSTTARKSYKRELKPYQNDAVVVQKTIQITSNIEPEKEFE